MVSIASSTNNELFQQSYDIELELTTSKILNFKILEGQNPEFKILAIQDFRSGQYKMRTADFGVGRLFLELFS